MTESEWLAATDPVAMLAFLQGKASDRKLRLFSCACCRSVGGSLLEDAALQGIGVAEAYADGAATVGDLRAAQRRVEATPSWERVRQVAIQRRVFIAPLPDSDSQIATMATILARFILLEGCTNPAHVSVTMLRHQADGRWLAALLRHITGNPFRPYTFPAQWPLAVVRLAESLYSGEACSFALHDALLESGYPDLAEHFREAEHPKGCWVLDLILAKK